MSSKKSASGGKSKKAAVSGGALPPYGVPIREAIASGNLRDMKAMAAQARKHIAEIQRALKTLESKIGKLEG